MMDIVKRKTGNPTRVRFDSWFAYKTSKNTTKEFENLVKFAPELEPHWFEKELVTKRVFGWNGFEFVNNFGFAKWLFDLHSKGVVQGDFSPADSFTDKNFKVWVVDWENAHKGLQLTDVIGFVHKKDLKQNPKQFRERLLRDEFFLVYLDLCVKEYANQMIQKLRSDYLEKQPEEKLFLGLM